jgi:hypothetical protein
MVGMVWGGGSEREWEERAQRGLESVEQEKGGGDQKENVKGKWQ